MERSNIAISVVIPFYNAQETIIPLLQSLESSTLLKEFFEIILVNDNSSDASIQTIDTFAQNSQMKILGFNLEKRGGPAAARNFGIKVSNGAVIAFTDADCIVDQDWLAKVYEYAVEGQNTLIGGTVASTDILLFPWKVAPAGHKRVTTNLAVHKSVVEGVWFDEKYKSTQGEDKDLIFRLEKSGQEYQFFDDLVIIHPPKFLGFSGVVRSAMNRQYDNLLYKMNKEVAIESIHPMFRPISLNLSPMFYICATITLATFILVLLVSWKTIFVVAGIVIFASILFMFPPMFGFFITYKPENSRYVGVLDRIKCVFYSYVYLLVALYARVLGSVKYGKVLL